MIGSILRGDRIFLSIFTTELAGSGLYPNKSIILSPNWSLKILRASSLSIKVAVLTPFIFFILWITPIASSLVKSSLKNTSILYFDLKYWRILKEFFSAVWIKPIIYSRIKRENIAVNAVTLWRQVFFIPSII